MIIFFNNENVNTESVPRVNHLSNSNWFDPQIRILIQIKKKHDFHIFSSLNTNSNCTISLPIYIFNSVYIGL